MTEAVLITGGAGFLGSHLCDRFLQEGARVECIDNLITGSVGNIQHLLDHERFHFVEHDITIPYIPKVAPDAVLNLASPASPPAYLAAPIATLKTGSIGTLNALGIARESGATFLMASTSEIYGDPEVHPQPESYRGSVSTTGPRSVYDEAKRFAEAITMAYRRAHGVDTRIARIFNTYGPRLAPGDGRAIPNFIAQALAGEAITLYGDGSQTRSFCYVTDMVEGLVALLRSDEPEPVNLGNPDERSILDLAHQVIKVTGSEVPIEMGPLPVDDPRVRCPDITRAHTILGWEPRVPFSEGLAETVAWFRSALPLAERP